MGKWNKAIGHASSFFEALHRGVVLRLQCASASLLFCMLTWHAKRGRRGHVTHTTCGRTGVLTIHKHIFLFSANVAPPRGLASTLKQAHTYAPTDINTHTRTHMHTYAKRVKLKWQSKAGPTTMAARGKTGASQVCGCCSCCSYCYYCCCWESFLFMHTTATATITTTAATMQRDNFRCIRCWHEEKQRKTVTELHCEKQNVFSLHTANNNNNNNIDSDCSNTTTTTTTTTIAQWCSTRQACSLITAIRHW